MDATGRQPGRTRRGSLDAVVSVIDGRQGSWPSRALFACTVVLSLIFTVIFLSERLDASFWRDETATASAASRPIGMLLHLVSHQDGGMVGYYVLMKGWASLAGTSEPALRAPSVVGAVVAVVGAAALSARIGGFLAGTIAAIVMVRSQAVLLYGWEARPYALATGMTTIAALIAREGSGRSAISPRVRAIAWTIVAAATISLNLYVALALAPQLLWFWRGRPIRRGFWRMVTIGLLPLAMTVLVAVLALRATVLVSWIKTPTLFWIKADALAIVPRADLALLAFAAVATLAAWSFSGRLAVHRSELVDGMVLVLWAGLPLATLACVSLAWRPLLDGRYCTPSDAAAAVLVGICVSAPMRLLATRQRPLLASLVSVGLAAGLLGGIAAVAHEADDTPHSKSENLRAAAVFLKRRSLPSERVIFAPTWAEAGLSWYLAGTGTIARPTDLAANVHASRVRAGSLWAPTVSLATAEKRLASLSRVWVAGYPGPVAWKPVPDVGTPLLAILRKSWNEQSTRSFGSIVIELWTRRLPARR